MHLEEVLPAHPLSSEARRRLSVERIPAAGGQELFCLTTTTTTSSSARTERALYVPGVFPISTEQQHLLPSEDQNSCFLLFLAFFDPDARDQFAQKIPIFQFLHLCLCFGQFSFSTFSWPCTTKEGNLHNCERKLCLGFRVFSSGCKILNSVKTPRTLLHWELPSLGLKEW